MGADRQSRGAQGGRRPLGAGVRTPESRCRDLLLMAALVAAICVFAGADAAAAPPDARRLPPTGRFPASFTSTPLDPTAAARPRKSPPRPRAPALKFIVFTDHGDATRHARPAGVSIRRAVSRRRGDQHRRRALHRARHAGVAVSARRRSRATWSRTSGGSAGSASPRIPIRRSPSCAGATGTRPSTAWSGSIPIRSWRVHAASGWRSRFSLLEGLLHYPIRPAETLASLLTGFRRHDGPLERAGRPPAGRRRRPASTRTPSSSSATPTRATTAFSIPLPGYEASFRMLSVHVTPERPLGLSGDAAADAALVMRAIRAGHLYMAIDGLASPPAFEFTATNARGTAQQGDELGVGGPVSLRVRSNAPPGFTTIIWRGSRDVDVAQPERNELTVEAGAEPAVYRAEVRTQRSRTPADVAAGQRHLRPRPRAAQQADRQTEVAGHASRRALFDGKTDGGWHLETDPSSMAAVDVGKTLTGSELRVRYGLGERPTAQTSGRRSAWGTPIGQPPVNVADFDRLTFTARAERPMRISVQLRTLDAGRTLRRWQRSVYLDTFDQEHTVYFDDLVPERRHRAREAAARPGEPDPVRRRHDEHASPAARAASGSGARRSRNRLEVRSETCNSALSLSPEPSYVLTVRIRYAAAAPKRMFGVHAASTGGSSPPAPMAAHTLSISQ